MYIRFIEHTPWLFTLSSISGLSLVHFFDVLIVQKVLFRRKDRSDPPSQGIALMAKHFIIFFSDLSKLLPVRLKNRINLRWLVSRKFQPVCKFLPHSRMRRPRASLWTKVRRSEVAAAHSTQKEAEKDKDQGF